MLQNRLKVYPNGIVKMTRFRQPIKPNNKLVLEKSQEEDGPVNLEDMVDSIEESLRRAKNRFLDYVLANDWTHWGMITYDSKMTGLDRYDLEQLQEATTRRLNKIKTRYDSSLKYLLVFEPHKNGGWHAHMFIYTENKEHFVKARYPNGRLLKDKRKNQVWNWSLWTEKMGFATFVDISHTNTSYEQKLKISQYATKYVTKNFAIGLYRRNKKKYWCSQGLNLPMITDNIPPESIEIIEDYPSEYKKTFEITDEISQKVVQQITVSFYNMQGQKAKKKESGV
jgi:hypothetical protein